MDRHKVYESPALAVADIPDGATVFIGGFGDKQSCPIGLIRALGAQGTKNLTIVCNVGGFGLTGQGFGAPKGVLFEDQGLLITNKQAKKIIASFPFASSPTIKSPVKDQYLAGELEVEIVPQGTLVERIRAGGAGIGAFYTKTGVGTEVAKGKASLMIDGEEYIREYALKADFALIKANKADGLGNLVFNKSTRNFNPIMAMAARVTIVEVDEIVASGELDPDHIITPFVYVDRLVKMPKERLA